MISQENQKPNKTFAGPKANLGKSQTGQKEKSQFVKYGDLHLAIFPDVYDPHEDSFMLAKAAKELSFGSVLDLGCGSGILGLSALQNKKVTKVTFADISESAIENAKQNFEKNEKIIVVASGSSKTSLNKRVLFVKSNLFQKLENEKFDTIIFNPPYLPTTNEEQLGGNINRAFDGGKDGRQTIAKFLLKFPLFLSEKGILLFLDSSLSDSIKTEKKLASIGFKFDILSTKSFFFEKLRVLKVYRKSIH
ncbi:methyltransferase [Candidatus Micrarchaeota archaeon]|nr:methyltransferase [Candidatus Micrarchaeota archaeon]